MSKYTLLNEKYLQLLLLRIILIDDVTCMFNGRDQCRRTNNQIVVLTYDLLNTYTQDLHECQLHCKSV